jgi:glycine hydroxymethyltransferase
MTSRGLKEADFVKVADFIDRAVQIALDEKKKVSTTKLIDFKKHIGNGENIAALQELKKDVITFSESFPTVGFNEDEMTYQ